MTRREIAQAKRQAQRVRRRAERLADATISLMKEADALAAIIEEWTEKVPVTESPRYRQPVADKYHAVDWTKQDATIARELGVSRERIRQVRNKLGKPKAIGGKWRRRVAPLDTTNMTLPEIARAIGADPTDRRKLNSIRMAVVSLGKEYQRRKPPKGPRPEVRKHDWDSVDWVNKYDSQIAREMGIKNHAQVTVMRKRLNKPKGPDGRAIGAARRRAAEARRKREARAEVRREPRWG